MPYITFLEYQEQLKRLTQGQEDPEITKWRIEAQEQRRKATRG